MAKIKIVGNSLTLVSDVKAEDLNRVLRVNPKAGILFNEDNEEIFRISMGSSGSMSKYGVVFDSKNSDGNAYITIAPVNRSTETTPEAVTEAYLPIIDKLTKLESKVTGEITDLTNSIEDYTDSVEILD